MGKGIYQCKKFSCKSYEIVRDALAALRPEYNAADVRHIKEKCWCECRMENEVEIPCKITDSQSQRGIRHIRSHITGYGVADSVNCDYPKEQNK